MRSHAKASTAGSTQRQAQGLGRFIRGAFAGRGVSSDAKGSGASAARRVVLPVGVVGAIALVLALLAAPASALKTHLPQETFGSAAQPTFSNARSIAIDQSSGDVLVLNSFPNTINRYNPDGTPDNFSALGTNVIDGQGSGDGTPQNGLSFFGASETQIAVDNSGTATDGNIYVTHGFPDLINIFSEDGEYLGQLTAAGATPFADACGVAVDSSGAVYVGGRSGGIHKFVPAASPPVNADNTATFTSVSEPCTLAAGAGPSAGFLFAAQSFGSVSKIDSSSGELKYTVSSDTNVTLTVAPGSGNVLAATASFGPNANTIKEFDVSGAGSATSISTIPLGNGSQGVATDSGGDIFASVFNEPKISVFDSPVVALPDVVTASASNINQTTATLNGTVNPDGDALEECKFEYGANTSYGQSVPCAESTGAIGTGTSPVPVHADISGLTIGTIYNFRLVARNANGTVEGSNGSFETSSKPVIKDQWAHDAVYTEATLKAKINPKGFATTYHIDFGTTNSYGQSTPEIGVGSDEADHVVTRALAGLSPDTTYHYRFVATNEVGITEGPDLTFSTYPPFAPETNCANQGFRTGPALNLADCRAYEMVSPVDKNGGDIATSCEIGCYRTAHNQASVNGDKFTYSSYKSFGNQPSAPYSNQYLATRGPDGWSTDGINAPQTATLYDPALETIELDLSYFAFSDDLSSGWLRSLNKTKLPGTTGLDGYGNLYRRDNTDGSFEALTINSPTGPAEHTLGFHNEYILEVQGVSRDESHVVYSALAALTPDASTVEREGGTTYPQLYDFHDGQLELVSVLPDGTASSESNGLGGEVGGGRRYGYYHHAVSEDGSRIFWTAGRSAGYGNQIYVRIDGETTVPVSSGRAHFLTASTDGSKALYSEEPFNIAPEGKGDLYVFDVDSETSTLIAGEVFGVLGASDDLSYVYLVSKEDLDAGATAGERNVYLYREGSFTFIATGSSQGGEATTDSRLYHPRPRDHSGRVSPDGRHAAFESYASLTGYDNTDTAKGVPAQEVFIYNADEDELSCASCRPSGARPLTGKMQPPYFVGEENFSQSRAAAWLSTAENAIYEPRTLTDDGNRLFFNAFDALVPEDNNGVQDVYEWRAQGVGACQRAEGCISLISTGENAEKSEFVDASASGGDVFFETESSIHPEDPGLIDIYDARVQGGYPYTAPPTPCVGDACQNVPPAPNDATPASASFKGAGDPKPRKTRPRCRARTRKAAKGSKAAKRKAAKRCSRAKRRAGR